MKKFERHSADQTAAQATSNNNSNSIKRFAAACAIIWTVISQSLRGSDQDLTTGPIRRSIFILAIPMVLEMVMEGVFAVVDVFFVGKLGSDAIATVGFTESILTLIYILALGLSVSITAVVARRMGEKDYKGAASAAVQSFILSTAISLALGIVGAAFSTELLSIMGASPEILRISVVYSRLVFGGNFVIILLFVSNAILRGAGDGHTAMRALWLANLINIALNPCFIFGWGPFPELGLVGAAVATLIGRGVGVLYSMSQLIFASGRLRIHRTELNFQLDVMKTLVRLSASGIFQNFIGMASWIFLVRIIAPFGSSIVAGYTLGMRIILFILLPAMGLSNAAATLVGQSLGAKNPDRAEESVWLTCRYNLYFLGTLGVFFTVFARPVIGIFTNEPVLFEAAVVALQIMAAGLPFYAYGLVLIQAFNGSGNTSTPTGITFASFWVFEIPLAYALSTPFQVGPKGAYFAVSLSLGLTSVISIFLFKQGKWKLKVI